MDVVDHRLRGRALEGHFPGEHLVEDDAHRVDVAREVGALAPHLLGAHELGRAHHLADRGGVGALDRVALLGEAEVHEPHPPLPVHHDVRGLEVAVDDAGIVHGFEAAQDLQAQVEGQRVVEARGVLDPATQVHPVHELHRDVADSVGLAVLVDGAHVGMAHAAGELDLRAEAMGDLGRPREVRSEDLDRDRLVEGAVVGLVHTAHAAAADDGEDLVAVAHHRARKEVGHGALAASTDLGGVLVLGPTGAAVHLIPRRPTGRSVGATIEVG